MESLLLPVSRPMAEELNHLLIVPLEDMEDYGSQQLGPHVALSVHKKSKFILFIQTFFTNKTQSLLMVHQTNSKKSKISLRSQPLSSGVDK